MKKVRRDDLENLIVQYYCNFIKLMPLMDIADGDHGVSIIINSVYISVIDYNEFDTVSNKESLMQEFAKQI